jgi:hypothetical protein
MGLLTSFGTWRTVVVAIALSACAFLLVRHGWSLAHRRNALDRSYARLEAVRAAVPEGTALRFVTDREGDARLELMLRTQFLLAPRVLHPGQGEGGLTLVIDGPDWLQTHADHDVIWEEEGPGSDRIVLIRHRP